MFKFNLTCKPGKQSLIKTRVYTLAEKQKEMQIIASPRK
jgi:hypothetical protein